MYNNLDNKISEYLDNMSINEKNELLNNLENKNNIIIETNIIETLVTVLLDTTTLIAKCLKII